MRQSQVRALSELKLFSGATRRQLLAVAHLGTIVDVPEGRVLCRQGQPGRELFVVLAGVVALMHEGVPVGLLREDDWWGDAALSTGNGRHAFTAMTASRVTLLVYAPHEYRALLRLCPPVARHLTPGASRVVERAGRRDVMAQKGVMV